MAADPAIIAVNAEQMQPDTSTADDDLLSAIEQAEGMAYGGETDALNNERATAIDYYLGQPFGNEVPGRSQVVSKDLFDSIEWIKPPLLRIFAGGDDVCKFLPQGPEDVAAAKQESDYINHVIKDKNNWFMVAYEWFTDALLTRNAYALGYWEAKQEAALERYQGLTDDQMVLVGNDQGVQIVAHKAYQSVLVVNGQQMPVVLHDVDLRRIKSYGCAKICVLPPERCLVQPHAKSMSVREDDFFEYWDFKTISQLRVEGFDVPDDIDDTGGFDRTLVDQSRDIPAGTTFTQEQDNTVDPSMRRVKVRMVWMRHDYDGDGIAEMRYCVVVGRNFLVNQETSSIKVASIVPTPMPHRHVGLSIYDHVMDLQQIRSMMLRAGIDNQFLANNTRTAVNQNTVNLDDLLASAPGSAVRVDGPPGPDIMPFVQPNTVPGTIEFLNYLDAIKQNRTGTQAPMAGADMDAIMAQPGTVAQLVSAASQKIELIARVFAEGVKELFQIVHELTLENATVEDRIELNGTWVTVDPRQWKKRSDMHLVVGLGLGQRQQHVASIAALLGLQEKALGVGLTSLPKIYNGLSEYVKALGFASCEQFFDEPPPGAQLPQQTPYQVQVAQINAQAQTLIQQMKLNGDATVATLKAEADAAKTYFQEQQETMRRHQENFIRVVSEATDRMHELRLQKAKGKE